MRSIIILAGILACAAAQAAEDGGGGRSAQAAKSMPQCMVMHPAIKIDSEKRRELDAWYADCLKRHKEAKK